MSGKNAGEVVCEGARGAEVPIFKKDGKGFYANFLQSKQVVLGSTAEKLIAQKQAEIRSFRQEIEARQEEQIEMARLDTEKQKQEAELKTLKDKRDRAEARINFLEEDDGDDETPLLARQQEIDEQKKLRDNYQRDMNKIEKEISNLPKTKTKTNEQEKINKLKTQLAAKEEKEILSRRG